MTKFIFEENYTFDWPVAVQVPTAGGFVEQTFTAKFRLLPDDEVFGPVEGEDQLKQFDVEVERVKKVIAGWGEDLETPDSKPLPFTLENLDRLARIRPIRLAIVRAWTDAVILGGIDRKN